MITGRGIGRCGGQVRQQAARVALSHEAGPAGREVHIVEPCPQQHPEIVDALQIRIGRHPSGQGIFQHFVAVEGGIIGQAQDNGGAVGPRAGKMLVHDTQDVQLVGITHGMADAGHPFRQARGQGKAVVQAHGSEHQLADGGRFVFQALFALEDAHAPLAVVAGLPVAEGMPAQVLLEAGDVMVQGRQQTGAVQRRCEPAARDDGTGMGQHLHGVVQFEIHGRRIAAVATTFLFAFTGRVGGEPGFMTADVRQDGGCGVHVSGCTPRPGGRQGAVGQGSVALCVPFLSAGIVRWPGARRRPVPRLRPRGRPRWSCRWGTGPAPPA